MKKRDVIQTAAIHFLPEVQWDINKALHYAERLWQRLDEKGYGESKSYGPRDIPNAYESMDAKTKAAFDLFWVAFDLKKGKENAAARWLQLGDVTKKELDEILAAAKRTATERKQLPAGQTPIYAQGWLTDKRWRDSRQTGTEKEKQQRDANAAEIRKLTGDLNHAKAMAENDPGEFWQQEIDRLTEKLTLLRNQRSSTDA